MLRSAFRFSLKFDWILFLGVLALVVFGFVAIYSLSLSRESEFFWTLQKQMLAAALGFSVCLGLVYANYKFLRGFVPMIYLGMNMLLLAVLLFGKTIRGTRGWFFLGPVNFQPVELAKIGLIIVLARYFAAHTREPAGWKTVFESGILVGIPAGLTLLQPDLGSALVLLGIWALSLLVVRVRRHVFVTSAIAVLVGVIAGWFLMAPYQKDRILTFIDPARDAKGSGYNVIQARIAIGSGGLFGRGIGYGSQSQLRFLPESQTDFIFSVLGEELGFLGVVFVFGCFGLVFYRLVRAARTASDDFGALLVVGYLAFLVIQFTVNVGMNIGLLPVTGIPLPFVSYGSSALLLTLSGFGIALSVAARGASEAPRWDRER